MSDRRQQTLIAGLALAFLLLMAWVYWSATRSEPLPEVPRPAAVAPAPAAPEEPTAALPVQTRPTPSRAELEAALQDQLAELEEPGEEAAPADDPLPAVELSVTVVDDTAEPLRHVPVVIRHSARSRPLRFFTNADGRLEQRVEAGVLFVLAERADGMLVTRSEPVEIDAREGGSWSVELVIASEPRAGLGVSIAPAPEGVRIVAVHAGTPAEEAGLATGDIVTAVEGTPAAGMELPSFVELMTGPEGTKVLFDILREDGTEERLQIERAFLEKRRRREE